MPNRLKLTLLCLGGIAAFSVSFAITSAMRGAIAPVGEASEMSGEQISQAEPLVNTVRNPYADRTGTHLISYVIASSDCGWSSQPSMLEAIRTLPAALRARHSQDYREISVVGVLSDSSPNDALTFGRSIAEDLGVFDQVLLGGAWLNDAIVELIWRRDSAVAASPQVIVVERDIDASGYISEGRIRSSGDHLIFAVSGSRDIEEWITKGAPLPARVAQPHEVVER